METTPLALWTLAASAVIYQVLYELILYKGPTHTRFVRITRSRQTLSIFHCSLQSILTLSCLNHHSDSLSKTVSYTSYGRPNKDSEVPFIGTKSGFANCITALEAGYLLHDTYVLLQAYSCRDKPNIAGSPGEERKRDQQVKGWSFLHLGLHHIILCSLLLVLQYYIAKGRERGILIIVALHLMNASSIFGTVRWFMINFYPDRGSLILLLTIAYLVAFAVCRLYVVYWILEIFSSQEGSSIWQALVNLRVPCKIGTFSIVLVNAAWLVTGVRNVIFKSRRRRKTNTSAKTE